MYIFLRRQTKKSILSQIINPISNRFFLRKLSRCTRVGFQWISINRHSKINIGKLLWANDYDTYRNLNTFMCKYTKTIYQRLDLR